MSSPHPPEGFELSEEWWSSAPKKDLTWLLYALDATETTVRKANAALRAFREDPRWKFVPANIKEQVNGRLT